MTDRLTCSAFVGHLRSARSAAGTHAQAEQPSRSRHRQTSTRGSTLMTSSKQPRMLAHPSVSEVRVVVRGPRGLSR
jgi:hypothetical protein